MNVQQQLARMDELCALRRPLTGAEKWEMLDLKEREAQRTRWRRWYHERANKKARQATMRKWRALRNAS